MSVEAIAEALVDNLRCLQGKRPELATRNDWYVALAYTVRDRLLDCTMTTLERVMKSDRPLKAVAYLSAEFLTGPHLGNSLVNLGMWEAAERAVALVGQDLSNLIDQEEEPGLGNGGLGRLAACYMDSLSTLQVPAIGYGIRYEFGIFDQAIVDGQQVELTDKWLRYGNPWELVRAEVAFDVNFGGWVEREDDGRGGFKVRWRQRNMVTGVADETPVPDDLVASANVLRLWKAEAIASLDCPAFNPGDYRCALEDKVASETISKVL